MIAELNKHLSLEISAHTLYVGFAKQFSYWGYSKLGDYFKEAAAEELDHANTVMNRIMQLGGDPDYVPKLVGKAATRNIPSIFAARMDMERKVLDSLTMVACTAEDEEDDWETFSICQKLITATEEDIEWTQRQLDLIAEIGLQNYLQAQL